MIGSLLTTSYQRFLSVFITSKGSTLHIEIFRHRRYNISKIFGSALLLSYAESFNEKTTLHALVGHKHYTWIDSFNFAKLSEPHINTMISPWSSMKAFLSQQQQSHKASTPNDAEDINYAATACAYLNPNQDANLTTQQRIATELAGCDIMLSGYFNPEGGFRFIKGIKITRPLLTRDGEVVPEGHTRLSNIMIVGRTVPHTLHMYSHPYGSLEIGDLFKYLMNAVQELEVREGVFGIASLEDQISFCRIGGSFSRSSGVN